MIQVTYTFDKDGKDAGVGMEADTILDALVLSGWLQKKGYYNVTFNREEDETS